MPLFLVQTRKAINTGGFAAKWSNRYFVEVPDIGIAILAGSDIWQNGEAVFHSELAFCYEIYANLVGDAPFTPGQTGVMPAGVQRGTVDAGGAAGVGTLLPLFNVVRVDFPVVGSRPSRKFYRIPLREEDIGNAQISPVVASAVQAGAEYIAGQPSLRDVDGQDWIGSASIRGITSRRLGRDAQIGVPSGPAFG